MLKLYTVREVAHILKLDEVTIERWLRQGKLPGKKLGKQLRIRKDDLDEFTSTKAE